MRDRVYEKDKQTSFAKNHSVLGSKCLLTDIDAIQSTENEFYNEYWYESGKKSTQCRYFKAKVLTDHTAEQINQTIQESIDEKSIVFTDKSTSYVDISNFVELHITEKSNKETTKETLKWAHITISNAKRNLLGNYHKIKGKYLQLYLNEFVYKLNRRYFEEKLLDRLVIANITGL